VFRGKRYVADQVCHVSETGSGCKDGDKICHCRFDAWEDGSHFQNSCDQRISSAFVNRCHARHAGYGFVCWREEPVAPLAKARASLLRWSHWGSTSRKSVIPKFSIALATVPTFLSRKGRTRIIDGDVGSSDASEMAKSLRAWLVSVTILILAKVGNEQSLTP
jgi:hypothetical protein